MIIILLEIILLINIVNSYYTRPNHYSKKIYMNNKKISNQIKDEYRNVLNITAIRQYIKFKTNDNSTITKNQ